MLLGATLGCRQPPEPASSTAPRQVIVLLLDAARPDRFSCYGYPRLTTPEIDRLAAEGMIFHRHYTQGTGTRKSIPALLYSRYYSVPIFPNDPQVPYSSPVDLFRRPDGEQISFAKAFERAGFTTAAISAHFWIGEETPFAAEFMEMHDLTAGYQSVEYPYPRAPAVIDAAIGWIDAHREQDYALYVHLMDTHYPHYFEAEAQEFFGAPTYEARHFRSSGALIVPAAQLTADDRRYIDALYDGSLRYADEEIGRLLAYLRAEGLLAHTTIAITSDHGEQLLDGPGGRPRPGVSPFTHGGTSEPVAKIPLILYSRDRLPSGESFDEFSEEIDLAPTLLRLAEVPLPEGKSFDGVDLVEAIAGRVAAKTQVLMPGIIRTATHKAVFSTGDPTLLGEPAPAVSALEGRLYDLATDPWEASDLFHHNGEVLADLVERYRRTMKAPFERAQVARSGDQPDWAFAISSKYFHTQTPVARVRGSEPPQGWSRLVGEPHSLLIARDTDQPLAIRFKVPNGPYRLSFGMAGRATLEMAGHRTELAPNQGMVDAGAIRVTDEIFQATFHPHAGELLRIFFAGFIPPRKTEDRSADEERTRRLKALGYIE